MSIDKIKEEYKYEHEYALRCYKASVALLDGVITKDMCELSNELFVKYLNFNCFDEIEQAEWVEKQNKLEQEEQKELIDIQDCDGMIMKTNMTVEECNKIYGTEFKPMGRKEMEEFMNGEQWKEHVEFDLIGNDPVAEEPKEESLWRDAETNKLCNAKEVASCEDWYMGRFKLETLHTVEELQEHVSNNARLLGKASADKLASKLTEEWVDEPAELTGKINEACMEPIDNEDHRNNKKQMEELRCKAILYSQEDLDKAREEGIKKGQSHAERLIRFAIFHEITNYTQITEEHKEVFNRGYNMAVERTKKAIDVFRNIIYAED